MKLKSNNDKVFENVIVSLGDIYISGGQKGSTTIFIKLKGRALDEDFIRELKFYIFHNVVVCKQLTIFEIKKNKELVIILLGAIIFVEVFIKNLTAMLKVFDEVENIDISVISNFNNKFIADLTFKKKKR